MKYIIHKGSIIPESDFRIDISNRAFLYGDGLFETMILRKGEISFFQDHFARITEGLQVLGMNIPSDWKINSLEQNIISLCIKNNYPDTARIKLMAVRKPGGLVTPVSEEFDHCVFVSDYIKPVTKKEKVIFCDEVQISKTIYSKYKTCNFLPYIQASIYKSRKQVDEVIISDVFGNISECSIANIFWEKDGMLYTPSLDTGCIEGIMRKQIVKMAKDLGILISEGKYTKEHLIKADFAFTSNASGLSELSELESKKFKEHSEVYYSIVKNLSL